jgi:divalent metal cation (Fe/Co/Zn/Cd) transporter
MSTEEIQNVGKKWVQTEDDQLIKEVSEGKSLLEIIDLHKRKKGGICSRIKILVTQDKITFDNASKIIEMVEKNIEELKTNLSIKKPNNYDNIMKKLDKIISLLEKQNVPKE